MRLSEIRGEQALDVLANILDPISKIAVDEEFQKLVKTNDRLGCIQHILRNYKKETLFIMASLDGEDPKDYNPTLPQIPAKLLELLNDPMIKPFFESQGQSQEDASSGSATENTGAKEKE